MIRRDEISELESEDGGWTSTGGSYDADTGFVPVYAPPVIEPEPVQSFPIDPFEPVNPPADVQPIVYDAPVYVEPVIEPVSPKVNLSAQDPVPEPYYQPIQTTPPILEPIDTTPMYPAPLDSPCNCIMAPCDCDGSQPMPHEPVPMVQVSEPPPIVDLATVTATQTPPVTDTAGEGEPMTILGFPWYYAVGLAVAGLLLLSSTDGKN